MGANAASGASAARTFNERFIASSSGWDLYENGHAFCGRDDSHLRAALFHDGFTTSDCIIHFVVRSIGLVMEEHQLLHACLERQLRGLLRRRMSPTPVEVILF